MCWGPLSLSRSRSPSPLPACCRTHRSWPVPLARREKKTVELSGLSAGGPWEPVCRGPSVLTPDVTPCAKLREHGRTVSPQRVALGLLGDAPDPHACLLRSRWERSFLWIPEGVGQRHPENCLSPSSLPSRVSPWDSLARNRPPFPPSLLAAQALPPGRVSWATPPCPRLRASSPTGPPPSLSASLTPQPCLPHTTGSSTSLKFTCCFMPSRASAATFAPYFKIRLKERTGMPRLYWSRSSIHIL